MPEAIAPPTGRALLFVGTMGYAPNEDAARVLIEQILPRLRAATGEDVRLRIVGAGASERLRRAAAAPWVEIAGPVADVGAEYARACLVPIPLRAGGGTRIKLIEALAHGRAVVATRIAAEGIAVVHDRHLLIADEPEAFAAACLSLLLDPVRAERLAMAGRDLVLSRYDLCKVKVALAAGHDALYRRIRGSND